MELREGENCLQSDTRKYCRKQVTAVGVLNSGFLPPKKSQILLIMKNQFERITTKPHVMPGKHINGCLY